ncbi:MAG: Txe/YoeB family addiction module toxin [Alphaproteobacteria bacterium]
MNLLWTRQAWGDYLYWQTTDKAILRKINDLIRDVTRQPFAGLGKPEPLRGTLAGWWSRRITGDHRLVYRVSGNGTDQRVEIAQCRYHY